MESFSSVEKADDKGDIITEIPARNPEKKSKNSPEEIEKYKEEGQKMIDSYRRLFNTFARDISLKFVLSDNYYIDFKAGEIHLDAKDFADKEMNMDEILWSTMHELSHFIDMSEDPEGMLLNFEHIKNKTKSLAEKVVKKYKEAGVLESEVIEKVTRRPKPTEDGEEQLTPIEKALYKVYHSFYNCLDDIYVNNVVSRKAPKFEKKRKGGKEIKNLYKNKLFKESNYEHLPRHLQFVYTMLREEMVGDEKVKITDEVKEVFEREVVFEGETYTVRELIDNFIIPKSSRNTKPTKRYKTIKKTLEPIFDELLKKDLDEWKPKKPQMQKGDGGDEGEEGGERGDGDEGKSEKNSKQDKSESVKDSSESQDEGDDSGNGGEEKDEDMNPFSKDYKKFGKNIPNKLEQQDIKDWIDKKKEDKEKKEFEEEKEIDEDVEEKASEAQRKLDEEWTRKFNVDKRTLDEFRRIEREIAPYLEELSLLWREIVLGSSKTITRNKEVGFKTGELNLPKVIQEWPKIEKRDLEDVRVMERIVEKEGLIEKPELIRVRVVGDTSGSMFNGDGFKIEILKQVVVLILSSLKEFDTYLNMSRAVTKSNLQVDTEAWIFGDYPVKIKKFRGESGGEDEQARIVESVWHLETNLGGTYDDKPLKEIRDSITPEDALKISQKKIIDIVFEVTDGEPNIPNNTKIELNNLESIGVIVRGFQIGEVYEHSQKTFNNVWNGDNKKRGEVVGKNIENLIPAITEALKQYLKNVRL